MTVARTTKIITADDDVYSITTTPNPGETQAELDARHVFDIVALANFVESQNKVVTRFSDYDGCDIIRVDDETMESMGRRLLDAYAEL